MGEDEKRTLAQRRLDEILSQAQSEREGDYDAYLQHMRQVAVMRHDYYVTDEDIQRGLEQHGIEDERIQRSYSSEELERYIQRTPSLDDHREATEQALDRLAAEHEGEPRFDPANREAADEDTPVHRYRDDLIAKIERARESGDSEAQRSATYDLAQLWNEGYVQTRELVGRYGTEAEVLDRFGELNQESYGILRSIESYTPEQMAEYRQRIEEKIAKYEAPEYAPGYVPEDTPARLHADKLGQELQEVAEPYQTAKDNQSRMVSDVIDREHGDEWLIMSSDKKNQIRQEILQRPEFAENNAVIAQYEDRFNSARDQLAVMRHDGDLSEADIDRLSAKYTAAGISDRDLDWAYNWEIGDERIQSAREAAGAGMHEYEEVPSADKQEPAPSADEPVADVEAETPEYDGPSVAQMHADDAVSRISSAAATLWDIDRHEGPELEARLLQSDEFSSRWEAAGEDDELRRAVYADVLAHPEMEELLARRRDAQDQFGKAADEVVYMREQKLVTDTELAASYEAHDVEIPTSEWYGQVYADMSDDRREEIRKRVEDGMKDKSEKNPDAPQVSKEAEREKNPPEPENDGHQEDKHAEDEKQPPSAGSAKQDKYEVTDGEAKPKSEVAFHRMWDPNAQQQREQQKQELEAQREQRRAERAEREAKRAEIVGAKKARLKENLDKLGEFVKNNPSVWMAGSAMAANMDGGDYVKMAVFAYAAYKIYDKQQAKADGTYEGWFQKKARQIANLADKTADGVDWVKDRAKDMSNRLQERDLSRRAAQLIEDNKTAPDSSLPGMTKTEVNAVIDAVAPPAKMQAVQEIAQDPNKLREWHDLTVTRAEHANNWDRQIQAQQLDFMECKFYVNGADGKPIEQSGKRMTIDPYAWARDKDGQFIDPDTLPQAEQAAYKARMMQTNDAVKYLIDHNGATVVDGQGQQVLGPRDAYTANIDKYDDLSSKYAGVEARAKREQLETYARVRQENPELIESKIPPEALMKCADAMEVLKAEQPERLAEFKQISGRDMTAYDVYLATTDTVHKQRLSVSDEQLRAAEAGVVPERAEAMKFINTAAYETPLEKAQREGHTAQQTGPAPGPRDPAPEPAPIIVEGEPKPETPVQPKPPVVDVDPSELRPAAENGKVTGEGGQHKGKNLYDKVDSDPSGQVVPPDEPAEKGTSASKFLLSSKTGGNQVVTDPVQSAEQPFTAAEIESTQEAMRQAQEAAILQAKKTAEIAAKVDETQAEIAGRSGIDLGSL